MDGDWWPVASGQWLAIAAHLSAEGRRRRPPHPRRQPATSHQPPSIHASSLSGIAAGKVGEGAGRPGLARCCCRVTVSTKPDLGRPSDPPVKSRSGRDGTAPRSRFPRALRVVALSSDLTGSRRRHCCRRRAADMTFVGGPHKRRAASRRRPSIDLRKDPRGIHPPGFIARPQPADIGALDPTPSPPTG